MDNPFTYKITKDNKVIIYRDNKLIKIVKGRWSANFIDSLAQQNSEKIQLKLAKVTGHYKHGNERK